MNTFNILNLPINTDPTTIPKIAIPHTTPNNVQPTKLSSLSTTNVYGVYVPAISKYIDA
ncbi:hypothetical protein D3C76_1669050 [compost metagenome]